MSEHQTNKTTGGVWVACREKLPGLSGNGLKSFFVLGDDGSKYVAWCRDNHKVFTIGITHWLDTTVEIITKAEHDAAIAKLHNEFGCELRDPNGTIWEQASKLQKENEELRARIKEPERNGTIHLATGETL